MANSNENDPVEYILAAHIGMGVRNRDSNLMSGVTQWD